MSFSGKEPGNKYNEPFGIIKNIKLSFICIRRNIYILAVVNQIIQNITLCRYEQIEKVLPEDIDKEKAIAVFEKIMSGYLKAVSPAPSPFLMNVSGIPGAGKSTYCRKLLKDKEFANVLYLSFDKIMESRELPYWKEMKTDPEKAFIRWELAARVVGYELLERAVRQKVNILLEHSSALPQHIHLFRSILQQGYQVHFRYISISCEEAQERVNVRKRYIPAHYLLSRYEKLVGLLPVYQVLCSTYQEIGQMMSL